MNWARQNPFLAGLLGAVVLGVAIFGWLITTAFSRKAEVDEAYRTQASELQRLERLQPYPEESSRELLEEKKKAYAEAVTALQTQLAEATAPPLEAVSPTEFQGRLRDTIERLTNEARAGNIALPKDFYLGFEAYRTGLPTPGLAPLLAFQLQRCEEIARILIASRIDALTAFKRAPLPGEAGGSSAGATRPAPSPSGAAAAKAPGAAAKSPAPVPLVVTYPLELEFRAAPNALRAVVDELVKSPSFHLIRALRVKNDREKGPSRDEAAADPAAAVAATPAAVPATASPATAPPVAPPPRGAAGRTAGLGVPEPALPERQTLRYVVGMERVSAALRVEIVRFTAPPSTTP